MRKTFLINLALQVALNLGIKPLYILGVDRSVQNIVGVNEYGFYYSLLNFSLLLQIVNDFGIQNFTSKTIAEKPENASKYFSNLLVFKALLSFVYIALTFFVATIAGYSTLQMKMLFLLSAVQILSSFFLFFRANIAALGFYQRDSFLSVFDRLGLVILCVFLLFYQYISKDNGIWVLAVAQIISMSSACLIGMIFLRQKIDFQRITFDFSFLKRILFQSLPFASIAFFMTIYTRSDAVLLERLLTDGETQAGIYASAYRLLDALNSVTLIFGSLLLPMFSKQIGLGESEKPLLNLSLTLVSFLSISAAFLVFFYRFELIKLLYHDATDYAANILGMLILSYIPLSMMYVLGALATAKNHLRPMQMIFGIGAILNIALNMTLIPIYKAEGAAYTTLFTQIFVVVGLLLVNRFSFSWKKIAKFLIFSALHISTIFLLKTMNIQWWWQGVIAGAFTLLWSTVLGFWEISRIKQLLKK